MGQQYNRLGQRRAGGAWQWLIIGFFPGLLCGGLVVFLLLLTGVFNGLSSEPEFIEITQAPVYIAVTATPDPFATQVVQVITATPEPTEEAQAGAIIPATLPPIETNAPVLLVTEEIVTDPTAVVMGATDTGAQTAVEPTAQVDTPVESSIPAALAGNVSNLVRVDGGVFQYGADSVEIIQAAEECQTQHGGQCQPSFGDDSTPRVTVQLDTFWIEQHEVTFEQYTTFLNYQNSQGISHTSGCQGFICIQTQNERANAAVIAWDGANYRIPANYDTLKTHPAYGVTWYGAQSYCQVLGRRLPTEAEWEYAARSRGQDDKVYPWGSSWSPLNANVRQPLIENTTDATVPVTDFVAGTNELGLTHIAGNVAEWVQDYYSDNYYLTLSNQQQASGQPVLNPQGPAGGTQRVLRGGSFNALPFFARTVHRQAWFPAPETRDESDYPLWVGFRCASDTGAEASVPVSSDTVSPSSLVPTQIPASGDANANAQPTAPSTEGEDSDDSGSRG